MAFNVHVILEGGLVQNVFVGTELPIIEVIVHDLDTEGADESELVKLEDWDKRFINIWKTSFEPNLCEDFNKKYAEWLEQDRLSQPYKQQLKEMADLLVTARTMVQRTIDHGVRPVESEAQALINSINDKLSE